MSAGKKSQSASQHKWIGKSVRRLEDRRLITGRGNYVDDVELPDMAYARVLGSPYAHARIKRIDVSEAVKLAGVYAVATPDDAKALTNPLPIVSDVPITQYCMAVDKVRHVGEYVAAVAAVDRETAEDAIQLIDVEYEPLPAVVDPEKAMESGSPLVHEALGSNIALHRLLTFGDVERDFAEADHVFSRHLRWNRSGAQPLETVGAVASYGVSDDSMTIWSNSLIQTYFMWLIAGYLKIPANRLNVIPMSVGGSFGSKGSAIKVPVLAGLMSKLCGRPVKFVESRMENMMACDHHASDRTYDAELATDKNGVFKALRLKVADDYGAYLYLGVGTHANALSQVVGPYRIKSVSYELFAILTNKCQQGAYRGYGSEVNNWVVERMVDLASRELRLDPVEIRLKNFIRPEEFPYTIPTGNVYDSGNYAKVLETAVQKAEVDKWRKKQSELREQGRYLGIGIATCQMRSVPNVTEIWFLNRNPSLPATSSPESASITIDATGRITVTLHVIAFWGNSPETVAAQIVAEEFGVTPADVTVRYVGSAESLPATGPSGSRYTVMMVGALRGASKKIKEKLLKIAAHVLEANVQDLVLEDGRVFVKGMPSKALTIPELALKAYAFKLDLPEDLESGLGASHTYDHPYTTRPDAAGKNLGIYYPVVAHGCHIPIVEVDIETGKVTFLKYTAVHDSGTIVNPMTFDGHVVGGVAMGVGTAMYEQYLYDNEGQLLNASLMDYLMPSSMEAPQVDVEHEVTPSPFTEFGIKGVGEGGRMVAPAAVASAIEDALSPLGIGITEVPMTRGKIWQLARKTEDGHG